MQVLDLVHRRLLKIKTETTFGGKRSDSEALECFYFKLGEKGKIQRLNDPKRDILSSQSYTIALEKNVVSARVLDTI
jgi:hypothetical protein